MLRKSALAAVVLFFAQVSAANSATVLQAVGVTTDSGNADASITFLTENLINQRNLSSNYTSGVTDFATYIASNPTESNNIDGSIYASVIGDTSATLTFDLGGSFLIESLALWNRGPSNQGFKDFSLSVSDSDSFLTSTLIGSFTATENFSGNSSFALAEVFNFSSVTASFVRMTVFNSYGCCASASEIAFNGSPTISPVPIPASLPLLAVSLTILGLMRQKSASYKSGCSRERKSDNWSLA